MSTPRSDNELVEAARAGDDDAYAELWSRHVDAAVRAARQYNHSGEAEDIAAEAFTRILAAIRSGGGPDTAFRPYLLRTVSNLGQTAARRRRLTDVTADEAVFDDPVPSADRLWEDADRSYAVDAFRRLGREQQTVLWYVEVERLANTETARLLGTTPTAVGSLAYRARDALKHEFLQVHIDASRGRPECRQTLGQLGAYVRDALPRTRQLRVEAHLDDCDECRAAYGELVDVASTLRAGLLPILFAPVAHESFGPTDSSSSAAGAAPGTWAVAAAVGVALVALAAAAIAVTVLGSGSSELPEATAPGIAVTEVPPPQSPDSATSSPRPSPTEPSTPTPTEEAPVEPVLPPAAVDPPESTSSGTMPAPATAPSAPPAAPSPPPTATPTATPTPTEPSEPPDPEPEPPELEPPLEVAWQVMSDPAWSSPESTYFEVAITEAEPGETVDVAADSPALALLSPFAGELPAEPPIADDGVWDCGEAEWSPQQACSAISNESGSVAAVFGIVSAESDVVVELEITAEDREPSTVTLHGPPAGLAEQQ